MEASTSLTIISLDPQNLRPRVPNTINTLPNHLWSYSSHSQWLWHSEGRQPDKVRLQWRYRRTIHLSHSDRAEYPGGKMPCGHLPLCSLCCAVRAMQTSHKGWTCVGSCYGRLMIFEKLAWMVWEIGYIHPRLMPIFRK